MESNFIILLFCVYVVSIPSLKASKHVLLSPDLLKVLDKSDSKTVKKTGMKYLDKYGYKDEWCTAVRCPEETQKNMIKDFQKFAGLRVTGQLDEATVKQMQLPRCGRGDKQYKRRVRRYNAQGTHWKKVKSGLPLTWRYAKPDRSKTDKNDDEEGITKDLTKNTVRRILQKAMMIWEQQTNLKFKEIASGKPDVWIYFGSGSHGDQYSFDGVGGTLAHAFYPLSNVGLAGDMHFDDDEWYTEGTSRGRNLLWVATHELGHTLGLAHSSVRSAVMYPFYTGYKPDMKLQQDDIDGIRYIYGEPEDPVDGNWSGFGSWSTCSVTCGGGIRSRTRVCNNPTPKNGGADCVGRPKQTGRCNIKACAKDHREQCPKKIDAIWKVALKGTPRFKIITKGKERFEGKDNYVSTENELLSQNIDASFTGKIDQYRDDDYTVTFSGEFYTVYSAKNDGTLKKHSGPHSFRKIRDSDGNLNPLRFNLPNYIKKLEAALLWQRNGILYIFYRYKGKGYYRRYNLKTKRFSRRRRYGKPTSSLDYPTQEIWKLPREGPDAAISWKYGDTEQTYFVVGKKIYEYNDKSVKIKRGPMPLWRSNFLKCYQPKEEK